MLCIKNSAQSRVTCIEKKKKPTGAGCDNTSEFKTAESSDSVDNRERRFGEKCGRLFFQSGLRPSALKGFNFNRSQSGANVNTDGDAIGSER